MLLRLRAMLIKELKQMLRDPKMRMVIFAAPLLQMLVFAFALTLDVKNINIAVLDFDKSTVSYEIVDRFAASEYFKIDKILSNYDELALALDKGDVRGALVVSKGTNEKVNAGEPVDIQMIADGTMSNDAGIIFSYASSVLQLMNNEKLLRITGAGGLPVSFETRSIYNENMLSRLYYVPGLITLMIMVTSMLLTSIAIVREKEIGTIEQVMVTPIGRFEFILGKTLPFMFTGYFTVTFMFVIAYFVFGVVIKGSIVLLILAVGLNITAYLGVALFVSASSYTQQQALLTSFFILMPCSLLSGFMFPIRNMPEAIQYLTYLNPMRWGFEAVAGIVMKGASFTELQEQFTWELIHAVFFIVVASFKFKKTLD